MAQAPAAKPVQSESARSKAEPPDWLAARGIKYGEWYTNSKPREERACISRCIGEAGRVHACLGLHTMGFSREDAVKMAGGKIVFLSPQDVAKETGIRRDNVMRAMAQLKAWGLADWDGPFYGQRDEEQQPSTTQEPLASVSVHTVVILLEDSAGSQ